MSSLPKPVLRGHLRKVGIRIITGGFILGTINSTLFYFLYAKPKEAKYDEFYKNYDAEAHVKDLIKWGYFHTLSPKE